MCNKCQKKHNQIPLQCEDCKFSNWDFSLFAEIRTSEFAPVQYFSEQFDMYCSKHDMFFLQEDTPICDMGESGENNYHETCMEYYQLKDRYNKLLASFRAYREKTSKEWVNPESSEEFNRWMEWLKQHDAELYNIFTNYKHG